MAERVAAQHPGATPLWVARQVARSVSCDCGKARAPETDACPQCARVDGVERGVEALVVHELRVAIEATVEELLSRVDGVDRLLLRSMTRRGRLSARLEERVVSAAGGSSVRLMYSLR